jgi:6-pyruvoyltetrahydropterin/6-carboxytetrahydropterin synthase
MAGRFEIIKEFGFEAAHSFAHKPEGHENTRVHGHSFRVEVALRGEPDETSGCVADFENVSAALQSVRSKLDHHFLNNIPGLATPSLENLAAWIAGELRLLLPQLSSVTVRRPTLGESCRFDVA